MCSMIPLVCSATMCFTYSSFRGSWAMQNGGNSGIVPRSKRSIPKRSLKGQRPFPMPVLKAAGVYQYPIKRIPARGLTWEVEAGSRAYIDVAKIEKGRYYTQLEDQSAARVILIGSEVNKVLFPNIEDPCGLYLKVNGLKFRVIGVFAEQGKVMGLFSVDNMAVIPFQTMKAVFGRTWWLSIPLKVREGVDKEYALEEVRSIVRGLRGLRPLDQDNFAINQQEAMEDELGKIKSSIGAVGIGIAALSLLVGGIGIMNIMFVSVKERTKEIGIRKALGAKRWVILIQFLFEAVIIALIGGMIGLGLTSLLVGVINKFFVASMSLGLVMTALGVSIGVGIVSGIIPASQASRLDPIEAMRYE